MLCSALHSVLRVRHQRKFLISIFFQHCLTSSQSHVRGSCSEKSTWVKKNIGTLEKHSCPCQTKDQAPFTSDTFKQLLRTHTISSSWRSEAMGALALAQLREREVCGQVAGKLNAPPSTSTFETYIACNCARANYKRRLLITPQ